MTKLEKIRSLSDDHNLVEYLIKIKDKIPSDLNKAVEFFNGEYEREPSIEDYETPDCNCPNCNGNRIAYDNRSLDLTYNDYMDGLKYMCVDCGYCFHSTKTIKTLPLYDARRRLIVKDLFGKHGLT